MHGTVIEGIVLDALNTAPSVLVEPAEPMPERFEWPLVQTTLPISKAEVYSVLFGVDSDRYSRLSYSRRRFTDVTLGSWYMNGTKRECVQTAHALLSRMLYKLAQIEEMSPSLSSLFTLAHSHTLYSLAARRACAGAGVGDCARTHTRARTPCTVHL